MTPGNDRLGKIGKSIIIEALALICICAIIAGCTGQAGVNGNTSSNTGYNIKKLVIGTTFQIADININDVRFSEIRKALTHQGMVRIAPNGTYVPALADSWETKDAKTWVYHLNKSARWHDGVPVTSKDVNFTINYMKDKFKSFSDVESVSTPDDYTVVITLKAPNSNYLMSNINDVIYPMHIFQNVSEPTKFNDVNATIGSGLYKFDSFDKQAGVLTFKANDAYPGGKPAVEAIEIRMFKSTDTMVMALQKGEIDTVYSYSQGLPYYYVPKLLQNDDIKLLMINNTGIPAALYFNTNRAPYDNVSFRRAISLAINYGEIANLVGGGYGQAPNAGFVPTGSAYYVDTPRLTYNLSESKRILNSIGYKDVNGDGFREMPDGSLLKTTIYVSNAFDDAVRASSLVKEYLNAAGIAVDVRVVDQSTFNSVLGKHDIVIFPATPAGMRMYAGFGSTYIDGRKLKLSNVTDPEYQSIVDGLMTTADNGRYDELSSSIQGYYASQLPAISLYWSDFIQPYNKKYEGWTPNPFWGILSYETFYNLHAAC
ncbi:ABC-type dipeptide transport system, periplasmic component [Methanocella conradii HZ254]|uniref:ABC-type dipeptide transport system, periplasmic component n=1 Tax=Methanocella conradii (strain DSM 24694 / JCM 17849 / CGMCC 1.5162 / HZ254) TaxID=1041930 RepID=H8IAP7_METCZ|nr:ABC transporter substrate-binding protein [Methanocella conradii]AFD00552.1 ABC-type dipeptide transport system, periplasmic component [Methanocella conradii HZ254]